MPTLADLWEKPTETKFSFDEALKKEGVLGSPKEAFIRSLYEQESTSGKNTKTSNAGAVGGMQILPDTFKSVADKSWDINNPEQNARAGIRYASKLFDMAGGDIKTAAAGYYGGEGAIEKAKKGIAQFDLKNPKAPNTLQYGEQVANRAKQYQNTPQSFADLFESITPEQAKTLTKPEKTEETTRKSFVEQFKEPFKTFGLEEAEKESILLNASKIINPFVVDKSEAAKNLIEKGKGLVSGISNLVEKPRETLESAYKAITEQPGRVLGETVKGIIYDPETLLPIGGAGKIAKTLSVPEQLAQQTQRASVGAAGVTNKMTLEAALEIASPELRKDLTQQFAKGDTHLLNEKVLQNHLEADQLPYPIRLTEGQASGDPILISRERNERGFKENYVQRFNEQNKLLGDNAVAIKEKVSPNVYTTDYVADAQEIIDAINKKKQANVANTQAAYKELEQASGGKFPVDGKQFADNAIAVLNKEDRFDYLPSTIQKKLLDYAENKKEMNFNLFENLRTDLASEIRKAQRANDGNAAHVLGQVRNELENLPLKAEAAALKPLADKARSLAKTDFELERSNKAYNKVVNNVADSKDFVQDLVIRSKNADFANTLNILNDNPTALEHLRSGTMDWIINNSKDASGNFSAYKFNKYIENLDVNKKLFPLFGENTETIRNLANTAKRIEAQPTGSFVNKSNTLVGMGGLAKQYGGKLLESIPGAKTVTAPVTIAKDILERRKLDKQIQESLRPAAGTKLKDIGKK